MEAVVIQGYGGIETLEKRQVPSPQARAGELLVEVHACGLNPVDFKIREGALRDLFSVTFPRILGGDISGVVRGVGPGATGFKIGDEVFFSNPLDRDGGYAELVAVAEKLVAMKPAFLSHEEAASLPVVGLTSIQALRDFGGMKAGSRVLIHAGAGGVGSFAIQYAKAKGAEVFTTASAEKREYVLSLGADRVIDYQTEDFVAVCREAGGMDVVLETLGGTSYPKSCLAAREGGAVPCLVHAPDPETLSLADKRGVKTGFLLLDGNRTDLEEISDLVGKGAVRTTISRILSLDEVALGHELMQSGRTRGKLVIKVR